MFISKIQLIIILGVIALVTSIAYYFFHDNIFMDRLVVSTGILSCVLLVRVLGGK